MCESIRKILASWGVKEAFPAYGIVFLGVIVLIFTEKEHWGIALVKAFTSSDFLATSFAFIFTILYSFPQENNKKGFCVWGLIYCVAFFVMTKISPIAIGDTWSDFSKNANWIRVVGYTGLSIAAVIWTFVIVYQVKIDAETNSGDNND